MAFWLTCFREARKQFAKRLAFGEDRMNKALTNLLDGMAASVLLLNKAIKKQAALECIVIYANLIDGALRVGLILKDQLESASSRIDESLLRQTDDDPIISERRIYKMALERGVITSIVYDKLSDAYDLRNKCIHRYLLCSITYDDVTGLVFQMAELKQEVRDAVFRLEREQIEKGVGMTVEGPDLDDRYHIESAMQKERYCNLK